jgi:hypothetical protein
MGHRQGADEPNKMKPRVFISHASHAEPDRDAAIRIGNWVERELGEAVTVFNASDLDKGKVSVGENWVNTVFTALHGSAICIFVATVNSVERAWPAFEHGAHFARHVPVIPVCIDPLRVEDLKAPLGHLLAFDAKDLEGWDSMLRQIAVAAGVPETDWWFKKHRSDPPTNLRAPKLVPDPEPVTTPAHNHLMRVAFDGNHESPWVVYTCRFWEKNGCPAKGVEPLERTVPMHVPVDELWTVSGFVHPPRALHLADAAGELADLFSCSTEARWPLGKGGVSSEQGGLYKRDWIIVGENALSYGLLRIMAAYLPWWGILRDKRGSESSVAIKRSPMNRDLGGVRLIGKPGGMITVMPNPYNIDRRVMIVWGCHGQGQVAVESWLREPEAVEAIGELERILAKNEPGQIVAQFVIAGSDTDDEPIETHAVRRPEQNRQPVEHPLVWWQSVAPPENPNGDSPDICDLSVLACFTRDDQDLIRRWGAEALDTLPEDLLRWEDQGCLMNDGCPFGFHLTLYELFSHMSTYMAEVKKRAPAVHKQLKKSAGKDAGWGKQQRVILKHLAVLGSAVVGQAFLVDVDNDGHPSDWHAQVVEACFHQARTLPESLPAHPRPVPFPLHVTLARFARPPDKTEEEKIKAVAEKSRTGVPLGLTIETVVLALASRWPYSGIEIVESPITLRG